MVIASIDLQGGKVVQLRQGAELVLQREDGAELAAEFDRYGEVALIDLDAALGTGSNLPLLKSLLPLVQGRVGGGIRSPDQAAELLSRGARKVIIGSRAFRLPEGAFGVNRAFLEEMARRIGREHVIIAVDARKERDGYGITVDGWKTPTGLDLLAAARELSPFAGELLFTQVDREGTMTGIDLDPVKALRELAARGEAPQALTVAGGVSTLEDIEALAALGCDVQLGMALYTGKISLAEAFSRSLNWKKGDALLPVIAQAPDGQVLMTGFTDREALAETFKRGNLCFHSRTRNTLWMKGEHSGHILALKRLRADCDRDALLATVEPAGPVCHTGAWSCFDLDRRYTWERLQGIIADRFQHPRPGSYTATLDQDRVREKVREEAEELCTAKTHGEVVWEAADLLYFTTALMTREGVRVEEVLRELERRHRK